MKCDFCMFGLIGCAAISFGPPDCDPMPTPPWLSSDSNNSYSINSSNDIYSINSSNNSYSINNRNNSYYINSKHSSYGSHPGVHTYMRNLLGWLETRLARNT